MSDIVDIVDGATRFAEDMRDAIKDKIMEPVEPPNAAATIKKKGFDHPLMDTGAYYDSVEARITVFPNSVEIEVGVFDGQIAWYVAINEFGVSDTDHDIPERPAIRMAWDENVNEFADDLEEGYGDDIDDWWEND